MGSYAGSIPARFSIDHNGGSNYTFKFDVPPGIAKMHPDLSFNYSSLWENGPLGVGCQLNGISVIERCGATLARDGFIAGITFSDTDRLRLDHAPLVLRDGNSYFDTQATYETEIQSWRKIVPTYGSTSGRQGPDSFTVYAHDGKVYHYGTTADAQGVAADNNPTIMAWYLSGITDTLGNTISFSYINAGKGWRRFPNRIDYTANAGQQVNARRSVRFTYENRDDTETGFVAGCEMQINNRLHSLATYVDETLVTTYTLTYEYSTSTKRSRLTSVAQTDTQGNALPSTTFSWQDAACNYQPSTTIPTQNISWGGTFMPMDINGNGTVDFVNAYSDTNGNLSFNIYLSQLNGKFSDPIPVSTTLLYGGEFIPLDANGDGKMELVYATGDNNALCLTLFTATPSNGSWTLTQGSTQTTSQSYGGNLMAADVDGDGLTDLVYSYQDGDNLGLIALFSDGTNFNPSGKPGTTFNAGYGGTLIVMDANADGREDLLYVMEDNYNLSFSWFLSSGKDGFTEVDNVLKDTVASGGQLIPLDINADGNTDLIYVTGSDNVGLQILVNNGQTFHAGNSLSTGLSSGISIMPASLTASPVPEIVLASQDGYNLNISVVRINNAQLSMMTGINQFASGTLFGGLMMPLDLYGRGFSDLVYLTQQDDVQNTTALSPGGPYPDLVSGITDGVGAKYAITYSPMSDPNVYTCTPSSQSGVMEPRGLIHAKVSGTAYNVQLSSFTIPGSVAGKDVLQRTPIPKYVVRSYEKDEITGDKWTTTYTYADALIDRSGRGWLGFGTVSIFDQGMGTTEQLSMLQLFPCTQQVSQYTTLRTKDNAYMKTIAHTYQTPQQKNAWQIQDATITTRHFNFMKDDKSPDTTVTVTRQFDDYGNIIQADHDGNGLAARLTETNKYLNDETNWVIGAITDRQYYADTALSQALKKEQFEYDGTTRQLKSHKIWENVAGAWLTTTFGYDKFGNLTSQTDPSGFTIDIQIETGFHTFVTSRSVKPATGTTLTKQFTYEPAFGRLKSKTEAAGGVTTQEIDGIGRVTSISKTAPDQSMVETTQYSWTMEDKLLCQTTKTRVAWKDDSWKTLQEYYDSAQRKVRTKHADMSGKQTIRTDITYNETGLKTDETLPYFESGTAQHMTWEYDEFGRNISHVSPAADSSNAAVTTKKEYTNITTEKITTAADTSVQRVTEITWANGPKQPLPVSRKDADGGLTTYGYNGLGMLTSITDPNKNTTTITYDTVGRKVKVVTSAATKTITYNDSESSVKETIGGSSTTIYRDGIHRITKKTTDKGDTTFTYDETKAAYGAGMLTSVTLPGGEQFSFGYSAEGLITERKVTAGGSTYTITKTYTPDSHTDTITFPDGAVQTNTYGNGILTQSGFTSGSDELPALVVYDKFDINDHPTSVTYHNGVTGRLGYDNYGRIASCEINGNNQTLFSDNISRDATDAVVQTGLLSSPNTYKYDKSGRLQSATDDNGSLSYDYDTSGNCTTLNGHTVQYDGYAPKSGDTLFSVEYNSAGNVQQLQCDNTTITYSYDSQQQLVSANNSAFVYDYAGTRLSKSESGITTYYISPEYEVVQFPGGAVQHTCTVRAYGVRVYTKTTVDSGSPAQQDGIPAAGSLYYVNDYRNSTRVVLDDSGNVTGTLEYDPFGGIRQRTGSKSFRHYFGGGEFDYDINAYYMRSRYYDPRLLHFLTPDDGLGGKLLDRDTYNLYAYVSSDPLGLTDPSGHSWLDFIGQTILDVVSIGIGIGAILITGGALAGVVGSGLIGAGIGGLVYGITQKSWEKSSEESWGIRGWGGAFLVGGLTGAAAGAAALYVAPAIVSSLSLEAASVGAMGVKLLTGMVSGAVVSGSGKMLTNWMNGKSVTSGLGSAVVFGLATAGLSGLSSAGAGYLLFEESIEQETATTLENNESSLLEEGEGEEVAPTRENTPVPKQIKRVPIAKRWFREDKALMMTTIRFSWGTTNKVLTSLHILPSF